MFCKYCGTDMNENALYCKNCGKPSESAKKFSDSLSFEREKLSFCKYCGTKVDGNYCPNCGRDASNFNIKRGVSFKNIDFNASESFKNVKDNFDGFKKKYAPQSAPSFDDVKTSIKSSPAVKTSFRASLIFLGIMFVFSILYHLYVNSKIPYDNYVENFKVSNIFSGLNRFLSSVLKIKISATESGTTNNLSIFMKTPILIFMIIPFFATFIGGRSLFKNEKSSMENISSYAISAFMSSIIISLIALFLNVSIVEEDSYTKAKMTFSYFGFGNFLSVFITIFLIYLILSFVLKGEYKRESGNYAASAIVNYCIGILFLILVFSLATIASGFVYGIKFSEYDDVAFKIFSELGLLFSANFGLGMIFSAFGNRVEISGEKVGIFKIFEILGDAPSGGYKTINTLIFAVICLIMFCGIVLLMLNTFKKIKKDENYVKNIVTAILGIAIVNVILNSIIRFSIKTNASPEVMHYFSYYMNLSFIEKPFKFGFANTSVILSSLIFTSICAALCYMFSEKLEIFANQFGNKKFKIIYIISFVLIYVVFSFTLYAWMQEGFSALADIFEEIMYSIIYGYIF